MNDTTTIPERDIEIVESKTKRRVIPGTSGKLGPEEPVTDADGPRFSVYVDGAFHGACRTRERAEAAAEKEREKPETVTERAIKVMREGIYLVTDGEGNSFEAADEEAATVCISGLLGGHYPDKPASQNLTAAVDLLKLAVEHPGEKQEIQPIAVEWTASIASMDRVEDISMWHTGGGCLAGGVTLKDTGAHLMVTDDEMGYDTRPDGKVLLGAYPDDEGQEWIEDLSGEADDDADLLIRARKAVEHLTQ